MEGHKISSNSKKESTVTAYNHNINIHTECSDCMGKSCCKAINLFKVERIDDLLNDIVFRVSCSYYRPNPNTCTVTGYSKPMKFQEKFDQCNNCTFRDVCKYDLDRLMKEVNCTLKGLNYIKSEKIKVTAACNGYYTDDKKVLDKSPNRENSNNSSSDSTSNIDGGNNIGYSALGRVDCSCKIGTVSNANRNFKLDTPKEGRKFKRFFSKDSSN